MTTAEHQTHEQFWRELEGYAGMVAAEILEETEDEDERQDAIHEAADGSHGGRLPNHPRGPLAAALASG